MHHRLRSILAAVGCAWAVFSATAALHAQGAPPMNTDDPGTPDLGHWEFNFVLEQARTGSSSETAFPVVEFNYGLREGLQLSYGIAGLRVQADGVGTERGLSNSQVGVKWRFRDGGKTGWTLAVNPALEFNNPGSSSKRKGLVEDGGTLAVPFIFQRELGDYTLTLNAVHTIHFRHQDDWSYGVDLSREVSETVTLGVELYGTAAQAFDRSSLLLNVGASFRLSDRHSLMLSAGRELHQHDGDKATFLGLLGWQVRL